MQKKLKSQEARKKTRRAAINLAVNFVVCKNCGKATKPHIVCVGCGFYGGKSVAKEQVQVIKA